MLSKKEYCEGLVRSQLSHINPEISRKDAHHYIYQSSTLAVALEYLGELSPEEKEYSSGRAGTVTRYLETDENGKFKDLHFLTVRELIDLLPDEVHREGNNNE